MNKTLVASSGCTQGSQPRVVNALSPLAIGVFLHHRDVKVALEESIDAGFPLSWMTLIARNCKNYNWMPGLIVDDRFNDVLLIGFESERQFFYRHFRQGKYLLIVGATGNAIGLAQVIFGCRRHSVVWYLG